MSRVTLAEVKDYFLTHDCPAGPVYLDAATRIDDPTKFVQANLTILEYNSGNAAYMPYWQRLLKFYHYCKDHEGK